MKNFLEKYGLWIIFIQALLAMLGSLYYGRYGDPIEQIFTGDFFNPDNGFTPCELCRYARILMYPIVLSSLIAIIKKDFRIVDYIIPIWILGTILEIYHYTLQKFLITTSFFCTRANPCTALEVDYFGFITIPFLCLIAFIVILTTSLLIKKFVSSSD